MNKLIYLDAGHGGSDSGAVGRQDTREKEINLAITLLVAEALKQYAGVAVGTTRSADVRVTLAQRTNMANKAGAAVFVSIHCNSAENRAAYGTETYAYSKASKGYALAQAIHTEVLKVVESANVVAEKRNRGVKTANFAVLRNTKMPAALVEIAFLSNAAEEQMLLDTAFQRKVAEAIAKGICGYLYNDDI